MKPSEFFHHCPRCGARQPAPPTGLHFDCAACQFRFYFNPAVAIGVFIRRDDGRLLFIVGRKIRERTSWRRRVASSTSVSAPRKP
jgi:NADH pyrophosphatase NudC (nudix superfamily)